MQTMCKHVEDHAFIPFNPPVPFIPFIPVIVFLPFIPIIPFSLHSAQPIHPNFPTQLALFYLVTQVTRLLVGRFLCRFVVGGSCDACPPTSNTSASLKEVNKLAFDNRVLRTIPPMIGMNEMNT